jgi:hypothetical protein
MSGGGRLERRWITMSQFVFLFRSTEAGQREAMGTPERAQRSLQTWLEWIHQLEARGQLRDRGVPLQMAGKVVAGSDRIVTDGPYAEAKDLLLGFLLIEARDLDDAVTIARDCPIVIGGGSVEVRPAGSIAV